MDHGSYDQHQDYCAQVSTSEPQLLHELRRATHLQCIHPRMASGPFQGRILSMISRLINPERILEIGTYTGYSALCLAEGLTENGSLISIEKDDELENIQNKFFSQSPYRDQIQNVIGDALEIIPSLEGSFDLIFLDADKENYHTYLPLILEKCHVGSLILIDNMLWEGKVIFEEFDDERTEAIRRLTEDINSNPRLEQILLPIRDGLMVTKVIK